MSANPPVFTGKRKRTVVSYKEPEDLIELESESDVKELVAKIDPEDGEDSDEDDDDAFTTHQKPLQKAPPQKKAKVVKKSTKKNRFPFLDLPAELRDMIYELTLTNPGGVGLVPMHAGHRHVAVRGRVFTGGAYHRYRRSKFLKRAVELAARSTTFVPALLAVNKQINAEAINYLYGQDFIFKDTTSLHSFLASIGLRNQQRLVNIEVLSWGRSGVSKGNNHSAMTSLAGATNLKSLRLTCDVCDYSNEPARIAARVFGEAHWFLEAYGAANGRKDAAVDILEVEDSNFNDPRRTENVDSEVLIQRFKKALRALLGVKPAKKSRK